MSAVRAQTSAVVTIDVPAQPLGNALVEISDVFGVSVLAADDLVNGKTSKSIRGAFSLEDALERALQDTGLRATRSRSGAYVIAVLQSEPRTSARKQQRVDEEIIVTGTKQNLGLQDIQASVTVVTKEQIEERGFYNLEDIILRTPNLSTGGGSLNDISIRGISFGGVGGGGDGVTGNIYIDGAPSSITANGGALNLWDVEQVEALRGPQSTVQGRNALAGAIIFQTADPKYDFGLDARILIGNENSRQYSGAVTGPIIADQVAFRLSADYREVDFQVINQLNGDNTRFQEGLTLRGKLLFEPKGLDRLRLEVTGEYIESDTGALNAVVAPVPISDPAFEQFDPFGDETFAN
ncbi:MAG: TonB-dependent receptor, partial [Pseudomonadota bacterium]